MNERSPTEADPIPDELIEFVEAELGPGERLLWAAVSKPRPMGNHPTGLSWLVIALSCFGLSGLQFWSILGPRRQRYLAWESWILGSSIILFVAGAITAIVSYLTWQAYQAQRREVPRMTFGLSDRRAVIWSPIDRSEAVRVFTYFAGMIEKLHRIEYPDGSGDLVFQVSGQGEPEDELENDSRGFFGVDEVRRVEDLVRLVLIDSRI